MGFRSIAAAIVWLAIATPAAAQITTAAIEGTVTDSSGAVLPYLKSLRSMVPSASATRPST